MSSFQVVVLNQEDKRNTPCGAAEIRHQTLFQDDLAKGPNTFQNPLYPDRREALLIRSVKRSLANPSNAPSLGISEQILKPNTKKPRAIISSMLRFWYCCCRFSDSFSASFSASFSVSFSASSSAASANASFSAASATAFSAAVPIVLLLLRRQRRRHLKPRLRPSHEPPTTSTAAPSHSSSPSSPSPPNKTAGP